ncbi:MAG: CvpA family protein [Spirochaetia bacterium]|jgi:membrane protein required for colicin V production|nr:CvpA family protein [Spirochaetia bacterium]
MNTLDYILLVIIAIAALRCWFRGIIGEVLSAAALVGGLLAGILFYRPLAAWLTTLVDLGKLSLVAGFLLGFIIVFIAFKVLERSMRGILEGFNLDIIDKLLGFGFGAFEGLLISAVILLLLKYQPVIDVNELLEGSLVARTLLPIIAERLPPLEG